MEGQDQPQPIQQRNLPVWLGASVIAALIVGGGAYYFVYLQNLPQHLTAEEQGAVWQPDTEVPADSNQDERDDYGYLVGETRPKFGEFLGKSRDDESIQYDLAVAWNPRPVEVSFSDQPLAFGSYYSRIYEVGIIQNGVYAGQKVYLMYEDGMGEYASLYTFSASMAANVAEWIPEARNLPAVITDNATGLRLVKDKYTLGASLVDLEKIAAREGTVVEKFVPTTDASIPGGVLYKYKDCFFVRLSSDLLVEYTVDIPFVVNKDEGGYATPSISFTKSDGTRASGEYSIYDYGIGWGCGSLCSPLKVVNRDDSDFVPAGTADTGQTLFMLKNNQDGLLKELYNQPNTRAFVDTSGGNYEPLETNKYTYEQFLSMNPLLFWKDPLGRWAKFVHSEFLILAEKCKPVIYLYPEKKTKLHVEVAPNVGFTKTIPEYGDGWDVTAYPDGAIIDDATEEKYDYLYWTGWVESYPLIERGWVVAQKDLPAFFDVYLAKYGLVGREIEDFKEYWEEDLDDAPYYAVSFVDQAIIDKLSPLSLDVKPDVVIRVLMTAMPLEKPVELKAPYVPPTPVRHGFTVAEWGGTIWRTK
jgi:hypothetical protein